MAPPAGLSYASGQGDREWGGEALDDGDCLVRWRSCCHELHGRNSRKDRTGWAILLLLPDEDVTLAKIFVQQLQQLGYSLGKNLVLNYRSAEGRPERLADLAAELMQAKPDVLVAGFEPSQRRRPLQQPGPLLWSSPPSATQSARV